MSGRPNGPEISSDVESNYSDQFNLTWTVESYAEITAYRIIYRKYLVRTKRTFYIAEKGGGPLRDPLKRTQNIFPKCPKEVINGLVPTFAEGN